MCGEISKPDRVQQALDNAAQKKREKLLRRGTRPLPSPAATESEESVGATKTTRKSAKSAMPKGSL
jgi:hypothetical protein